MVETEMLNRPDINNQEQALCEVEKRKTIEDVLADFDSSLHSALFENDDEEGDFDIECARRILVDEGLSLAETVEHCDLILRNLNITKNESLIDLVLAKRDSIEFTQIIKEFDTRHKAILEENTSSSEADELLESMRCNELRLRYLSAALKKAATQEQCLEILGRTCDCREHAYIRQLVNEKMATLPVVVR